MSGQSYFEEYAGRTDPREVSVHRESILIFVGKFTHDDYAQASPLEDDARGIWRPYGVRTPGERGWACVHDGGDPTAGRPPVLERASSVDGVIHHVSTKNNWAHLDPEPHRSATPTSS